MCLAILKKPEGHVTKKRLGRAWATNNDGAGFMYASDGELWIQRGFFKFTEFYTALRYAEKMNPDATFVIHLRLATSGHKNTQNCHPFRVNPYVGFVHNGIFSNYTYTKSKSSDTSWFNDDVLKELPGGFLDNSAIVKLLESMCSKGWSKLVFLDNNGKYKIINECAGEWINNVWFSTRANYNIYHVPTMGYNTADWHGEYTANEIYRQCFICKAWIDRPLMEITPGGMLICKSCEKGSCGQTLLLPGLVDDATAAHLQKYNPSSCVRNLSDYCKDSSVDFARQVDAEFTGEGNECADDCDCFYCAQSALNEFEHWGKDMLCPQCERIIAITKDMVCPICEHELGWEDMVPVCS